MYACVAPVSGTDSTDAIPSPANNGSLQPYLIGITIAGGFLILLLLAVIISVTTWVCVTAKKVKASQKTSHLPR